MFGTWLDALAERGSALRSAAGELLEQELGYSTGHLAAILNTCLFAPSLLTFWFVNGVVDFSTAVAVGAVATPAGLQVRLLAYLLLVPTFLLVRALAHLLHPAHRKQLFAGSCPTTPLMSLDWVSMGILATGLPLALQDFGPWVTMNTIFLAGIFVLPRLFPAHRAVAVKLLAIVVGSVVFLYANYGGLVPLLPPPSAVLGPLATFTLGDSTTAWLLRAVNSVLLGPLIVGALGVSLNHILTRPELADVPLVRHALPRQDPDAVVLTSAAFGTVFYLLFVAALTGHLVFIP